MQAAATSPSPIANRVRVGVICHGEQLPKSFLDGLQREVIEARPLPSLGPDQEQDLDILLMWLSPNTPARVFQSMSAWVGAQESRVGLIGCAPNGDIDDTIVAFEAGVDDFVAGRCGVRELASRIHALRGRLAQTPKAVDRSISGLTFDAPAHEVQRGDRTIPLSSTEVAVLGALLEACGRTLSRHEILERAWEDQALEVGERAVDNVILRLRRKLGEPNVIETVRGVGFRLATD